MILLVPLVATGAIVFSVLAGIAFSPVAAASCAVLARRRGLSVKRYALAGGIYSVLLLAPYVYLVLKLLDRKPPEELVRWVYFVLMVAWVAGPLTLAVMFLGIELSVPPEHSPNRIGIIVANGSAAVGNVVMLGAWLLWLKLRKPAPEGDDLLPHVGYVLPFLMAPLGLLLWGGLGHAL